MTADPTAPAPRGALAREPLAPCPHCGPGQSMCDPVEDILGKRWQVFCGRCGSSSGSYKTEAESIAGWNRREAPALSTAALALDERDPEWPWTPLQAAIEWWQDVADNGVMEPKARAHLQVVLSELRERSGALRVGEAGGWRDISTAANDVLVERRRQTEAEGWTKEHDDAHDDGALARAAACYAIYGDEQAMDCVEFFDNLWPWSRKWWKPTDQRRNLVKAGALILAEIERIDRSIKARPLPAPPASGGE